MAKHKVLSTKKLKPRVLEKAKQNDIDILEKEFINVRPILSEEKHAEVMPWILSTDRNHIVFTSANAVDAVQHYLHQGATWYIPDWNIFCLNGTTKHALGPHLSEKQIAATAENAAGLAEKIIEKNIKEVVFFCGNKRRDELPETLKKAGTKVHELVVYETIGTASPISDEPDGVLFFSPSAVDSFFSVNGLKETTVCFAIGKTTAESIKIFVPNKVITSKFPSQDSLLDTVVSYFQNINYKNDSVEK